MVGFFPGGFCREDFIRLPKKCCVKILVSIVTYYFQLIQLVLNQYKNKKYVCLVNYSKKEDISLKEDQIPIIIIQDVHYSYGSYVSEIK